uniref:Uncharacterized protein n=1 Tax=Vitis vinifera TaxID=29760 RepID=F6HBK7_VITVI
MNQRINSTSLKHTWQSRTLIGGCGVYQDGRGHSHDRGRGGYNKFNSKDGNGDKIILKDKEEIWSLIDQRKSTIFETKHEI